MVKAVVLRVDSPGGDALASDLMWREIRLLAKEKPVIASMVDVAASGGYYMVRSLTLPAGLCPPSPGQRPFLSHGARCGSLSV